MKKNNNFSELMSYAGKHRYLTYFSLVLSVISAVLTLLPFVFIFFIIKEVIEVAPNFAEAVNVARNGWFAVLFALLGIVVYIGGLMCSHLSAFRIAGNMRKTLMSHIAKLPLGFVGEMGSGKIRRIVNDSSAATETYLAHQLPDMAGAIATPLGMIVMLFLFDWRFGLICLVPVVSGFAAMFKMAGPKMAEDMKNYQNALENMNNEAVEYVRGIPVVKTFGQTVHTFKRFKGSIDGYYKYCISYCKQCRMPMLLYTFSINSAFAFLITLALILAGGEAVAQSVLLSLIFYVIFTPVIATSMIKVLYMSENGMVVSDALSRVHSILDKKPLPDAQKPESPNDNSVEFENVSFRYDGADADAIDGISFKVTVALVLPAAENYCRWANLSFLGHGRRRNKGRLAGMTLSVCGVIAILAGYLSVPKWFVLLNSIVFLIIGMTLRKINPKLCGDLPGIVMPSLGLGMIGLIGIVNLM